MNLKAETVVNQLLEATYPSLAKAMQQATQELISDEKHRVYGGGRPDQRRCADAFDINCGSCEEWAERVRNLYAEATGNDDVEVLDPANITGDPDDSIGYGHVFIRHNGLFYDAECQTGVPEWQRLPLFQKQVDEAEYRHPEYGEQEKPDDYDSGEAPTVNLDDPTAFIKQEVDRRSGVKKIEVLGRYWWRRGAGGMYFKAYIYINDKLVHVTPEQGGGSSQYVTDATDWLRRSGYVDLGDREPLWKLRERGIEVCTHSVDVKRERDL